HPEAHTAEVDLPSGASIPVSEKSDVLEAERLNIARFNVTKNAITGAAQGSRGTSTLMAAGLTVGLSPFAAIAGPGAIGLAGKGLGALGTGYSAASSALGSASAYLAVRYPNITEFLFNYILGEVVPGVNFSLGLGG